MSRPTSSLRLAVDEAALAHNWRTLHAMSGSARAGAAVKADAYGTGAARVVRVLAAAGCTDFFVAHWSEADALRDIAGPGTLTVLHGPMTASDAAFAQAREVRPVINSIWQARLWAETGGGTCDLMVDTGMNRLGVALAELADPAIRALDVETLHSHLASADEDTPLNALQCARWQEARRTIGHRRAALANSAGIALGPDYHGDLTRPGLALYGGVARPELAAHIRQVVRPQAAILQVRHVPAGEAVGYNATFTTSAPMRLGTISIGYADGYLRCWSGKGIFRNGEKALRVLGRVSMDMAVIDLSDAPELSEGDWVEADYALPEAAKDSGLSQYELLTLLGQRFAR